MGPDEQTSLLAVLPFTAKRAFVSLSGYDRLKVTRKLGVGVSWLPLIITPQSLRTHDECVSHENRPVAVLTRATNEENSNP